MAETDQPQPTAADFALNCMAEDLRTALSLKAVYYGEAQEAKRTAKLLAQENQELRTRLENVEAGSAEAATKKKS